jgi:excisionase family DNA binding protein
MNTQVCSTATGLSSEQRILRLLQASPEQQAAIDRILDGRLAPQPPAPEAPRGPLLLRVKDAAILLGVHRTTMWRLVKAGRLETVELLGSLRVRRADVEALAAGKEAK